jgi:murein DD-endopeptidase MepM/ murein hydrolase activator NlpD
VGASDYSTTAFGGQYHTGLDLCPATVGCLRGDPVFASADGTVQAVYVTSDPAQTMCDGSPTGSLAHDDNHLGNTVILAHSNGKFSLYGNMDCVSPSIAPGVPVTQGTQIGNIGNSQYGTRYNTWTPHVHFEIKDAGVIGDPATGTFASFTPDLPDGYGYHDPYLYLFPSSQSNMSPTAVKVIASPSLNVLTGPDTSYSSLNFVTTGQEFVAYASSGSWYQIYLPNSQGPISGWIPASAGSQILAATDSTATKIQVTNTGGAGLLIRPSASSATNLVSWDNNSGFVPTVQNCATAAKIWDGQSFVMTTTQSGFDEFYLPSNLYFSSGNTCGQAPGPGPSVGWASSSFLQ